MAVTVSKGFKILKGCENLPDNFSTKLKEKLSGSSHGLNLEKIGDNHFSGRWTEKKRFHFSFAENGDIIVWYFDPEHDYDKALRKKPRNLESKDFLENNFEHYSLDEDKSPTFVVEEKKYVVGAYNVPAKAIHFDVNQSEAVSSILTAIHSGESSFVRSPAGNGKTSVALQAIYKSTQELGDDKKIAYIAKSQVLAKQQQAEFTALYPAQADKVRFVVYNDLLEEKKAEEGSEIALKEDFKKWFQEQVGKNGKKKYNKKDYPKEEVLFEEFEYLFCLNEKELREYKTSNRVLSYFAATSEKDFDRRDVVSIFDKYKTYLEQNNKKHSSNINLREEVEGKFDVIFVDEYQLFSETERKVLEDISNKPPQFFGDLTQAPLSFINLRSNKKAAKIQKTQKELALPNHYRSQSSVVGLMCYTLSHLGLNEASLIQTDSGLEAGSLETSTRERGDENLINKINQYHAIIF
jgi:hypothetical protein